jgi:hypothetical protein
LGKGNPTRFNQFLSHILGVKHRRGDGDSTLVFGSIPGVAEFIAEHDKPMPRSERLVDTSGQRMCDGI